MITKNRTQINASKRALRINSVNYARDIIKRLKLNKSAHVTKSSHQIIKRCDEHYSKPDVPIESIGIFMSTVANCDYQNVAISAIICHLFYLRIWRYTFRLINGRHHLNDLLALMAVVAGRHTIYLFNQFDSEHLGRVKNHADFMKWIFANIKASASMAEMFDLQQINRYWQHHSARLNPHQVYRYWW